MARNRFKEQFKEQLKRLRIRPKHSFGQNFLIDELVYQDILDSAKLTKNSHILEIGTGLGTLTRRLADQVDAVVTVENDTSLLRILPQEFEGIGNIRLVPGDFLQISLQDLFNLFPQNSQQYDIVANLPYNITAKILQKILYEEPMPKTAVLMMQREVAERITAKPGETSMISLMVQWRAEAEIVRQVAPESFYPSPEVHSAIIRLTVRQKAPEILPKGVEIEEIFKFAHGAFHLRRKKLANSLAGMIRLPSKKVSEVLQGLQLSQNVRPQELSIRQWINVFDQIRRLERS